MVGKLHCFLLTEMEREYYMCIIFVPIHRGQGDQKENNNICQKNKTCQKYSQRKVFTRVSSRSASLLLDWVWIARRIVYSLSTSDPYLHQYTSAFIPTQITPYKLQRKEWSFAKNILQLYFAKILIFNDFQKIDPVLQVAKKVRQCKDSLSKRSLQEVSFKEKE